jgi:hypothetical protein
MNCLRGARLVETLTQLAALIHERNALEERITAITHRPAAIGHLGEFIAAQIFQIELVHSASQKSIDGYFKAGLLAGASVNIKWYAKGESLLDITPAALPDYYLVLTGPRATVMTSRGFTRPWLIHAVYLFRADLLVQKLQAAGVQVGIATSVRRIQWAGAEIFPIQTNRDLLLTDNNASC